MSKKYYKVVSLHLCSCSTISTDVYKGQPLSVQYKIGEFVRPNVNHTSLMIFKKYRHAMLYSLANSFGRIFEVEAKGVQPKGLFVSCYRTGDHIGEYIKLKKQKKKYLHLIKLTPPSGTLFANEVKLVKEVFPSKLWGFDG